MLNKLSQLFSLLFSYKSNIFDIISKPKQAYTYTKFALELKELLFAYENDPKTIKQNIKNLLK
ncbi:hypothetical protein A0Y59_05125 [Campylobacter lari]|uniref:Uncharacterized protein n=1 Tax=Campylobacter lari TaxID=201 RepID=A0A7U8AQ78_CAMLA|nr:hypothetical protein [Campylobacter lari]